MGFLLIAVFILVGLLCLYQGFKGKWKDTDS